MKFAFKNDKINLATAISISLVLYWTVLSLHLPPELTRFFQGYSFLLFAFVLTGYYFAYRLPGYSSILVGLGFTLLLFALTLEHKWVSGYSDNFLIGGLLPYKDAKNYYVGANFILRGIPLANAGQATERPLFPGFFSTLLLFTGQNLKVSIAILVNLAGLALYYSSRRVFHSFGAMSASLYSTLLLFYIQPWVGYLMSEIFGFTMGCIAFSILWYASQNFNWSDFVIGSLALLIAISARAGAFLILPMLMLWMGWILRDKKRFSFQASIYTALLVVVGYLVVNVLYSRMIGIPGGSSFGNFSYALYGQVRGGTGWHSAIEELGTRNPDIVYRAALQFFLEHPFSLLIAIVKSYRDFFLPGYPNIFPFDGYGQPAWLIYTIWFVMMGLLFLGLFRLIKDIRENTASLLLAGFVGMILSIPFLPPIDGGSRFYASTVPFFFVIPVIALSKSRNWGQESSNKERSSRLLRYFSLAMIFFVLVMPIMIYSLSNKSVPTAGRCPSPQDAFVIQVNSDSLINFIQDEKTSCGIAPHVCLSDFVENNSEYKIDDFYQELYSMMKATGSNVRLIPTINLLDNKFHYFYVDSSMANESSMNTITGCAIEVKTENQSIFVVESTSPTK